MSESPESSKLELPNSDVRVGKAVGHVAVEVAHESLTQPIRELSAFDRATPREVDGKIFYSVPGKVSPVRMRLRPIRGSRPTSGGKLMP